MENDGKAVTPEVSAGTPAPTVEATVDPTEAKIAAAIEAFKKSQEVEISRKIQSEADKRVAPLQRRLSEAERRAQLLEGALNTIPNTLGTDDPNVVQTARLAQANARLSVYEQERMAAQQARQLEEAKQMAVQDARRKATRLGFSPDDPRLVYDVNQPDQSSFDDAFLESVRKAQQEDADKRIEERLAKTAADLEAKLRKDTGVDSHETAGTTGKPTFKASQFLDRKFYKAHQKEMDEAHLEGRVIKE